MNLEIEQAKLRVAFLSQRSERCGPLQSRQGEGRLRA